MSPEDERILTNLFLHISIVDGSEHIAMRATLNYFKISYDLLSNRNAESFAEKMRL